MKLFYKRLLSYFWEQTLETGASEINPTFKVALENGRLKLEVPNAIYSFEDLYTSFSTTFEKLKIHELQLKTVLVLGYGLGSIPFLLKKNFIKNTSSPGLNLMGNFSRWQKNIPALIWMKKLNFFKQRRLALLPIAGKSLT